MTHSLHRTGSTESLKNDYVILITPSVGINHKNSKPKLVKILDKILELKPTNIGSYETGTIYSGATIQEIKDQLSETPRVRCCFDDKEKIKELVKYIKDNDFGLSVTVSGLMEEILDFSEELDIKPHSVNLSLGIYGETERLPAEDVLDFITMCGHGMISKKLVQKLIEEVRNGKKTKRKAAEIMAKPCVCGIFNTERAKELLDKFC